MALEPNPSRLFYVGVHLLIFFILETYSQNNPIFKNCSSITNYSDATFKSNLDVLLSNLTSTAPNSPSLYSTTSVHTVYGLAQCRPNASSSSCAQCLTYSTTYLETICPAGRSAAVRFDLCFLRYSDRPFFSHLDNSFQRFIGQNASRLTISGEELTALMNNTRFRAVESPLRFGTAETSLSHLYVASASADCTRDLSSVDCTICLDQAVGFLLADNNPPLLACQEVGLSCAVEYSVHSSFTPPQTTNGITSSKPNSKSSQEAVAKQQL